MKDLEKKFDFDDILIVPAVTSEITSRYKDIILPDILPLFTAPMDTVVNLENIDHFINNKINVVLPRTIKYSSFVNDLIIANSVLNNICDTSDFYDNVFISLGFEDIEFNLKNDFRSFKNNAHILIDVASGHIKKIVDYAKAIKNVRPDIILMVGNIANPETYWWYAKNDCVDYIRIIIGSGASCLTTANSSVGYPIASLIHETYLEKQKFIDTYPEIKAPKIIADGGMKNFSDIIMALALGSDAVMIGSIFNKAIESAGFNYLYGIKIPIIMVETLWRWGFPIKKKYRGMSTKGAQKAMGKTQIKTSEGVTRYRKVEYHLQGWVENFEHYLRNAMSYSNAKTLQDFIGKVEICQITKNAYGRFNK